MPVLLAIFPLLGKLLQKLLRPIFNKYVRKALTAVFRPIWQRLGAPVWRRTGAPIWQKLWHEAPQKTKVKKQFDTVSHCPSCDEFAVTRVERIGQNRVLLKVVPGPAVGPRQLRAVCDSCAHERPVHYSAAAAAAVAVGSTESVVLTPVSEPADGPDRSQTPTAAAAPDAERGAATDPAPESARPASA
jgi:hypothetical protein